MDEKLFIKITEVTDAVHEQIDNEIGKLKKACQAGCNSCCHQIVDVFTWEEPKIFEFILNNFDSKTFNEVRKNLERWFIKFNANTRYADRSNPLDFNEILEIQHVFREKRIPCPFLIASRCSIYEARPMVCRIHYEKESAENCRNNPHQIAPHDAQVIFNNEAKKFNPAVFPVATKPLAYLVAEEFRIKARSKPMLGMIYDQKNMFRRNFPVVH